MIENDDPLAAFSIPDACGVVIQRRHHSFAVAAERPTDHVFQDGHLLAALGIPDAPSLIILRRRYHPLAVVTKRHCSHEFVMTLEEDFLFALRIPDARGLVIRCR